jgi:hypothetical protein
VKYTDQEIIDAYRDHGSLRKAATALGCFPNAVRERIKRLAERGKLGVERNPLPGFSIKEVTETPRGKSVKYAKEHGKAFETPAGHAIKGVSALLDAEGRTVQQWVKTRTDGAEIDWNAVYGEAFKTFRGLATPVPKPWFARSELLNLIPCNDWHINMLAWRKDSSENWDLEIAERVIGGAIHDAIARTPSAGIAVVLGGGDVLHNDDNTNRTAKSGNVLDCDGRHRKGLVVAKRLIIRTVEAALTHNDKVIIKFLQGNHDENSTITLAMVLEEVYKNEPRVTVLQDDPLFFFYEFGSVMLAATHGHRTRIAQLPGVAAARQAPMWGRTKKRYGHGFHVHHASKGMVHESQGMELDTHQAPIPPDDWHYGQGYNSGRTIRTLTYHRETGLYATSVVGIMDGIGNAAQ